MNARREKYILRCRAEAVELYNALVSLDLEPGEDCVRKFLQARFQEQPPRLGALVFLPFLWEEYTTGERKRELIELQLKGVAERQRISAEKLAKLEKLMAPLVSEGYKNEAITSKLISEGVSPYSEKSTARHVNTIAAKLRAAKPQKI